MIKIIIMGFLLLLSGCSNMSIVFEEDSVFYTPPKEVVNENIVTEKVVTKNSSQTLPIKQDTKEVKDTVAPIVTIKPDKTRSQKIISQTPIVEKEKDPENETTFSYDPYDGE